MKAILLAGFLALVAISALSHSGLDTTAPENGAALVEPPPHIVLTFAKRNPPDAGPVDSRRSGAGRSEPGRPEVIRDPLRVATDGHGQRPLPDRMARPLGRRTRHAQRLHLSGTMIDARHLGAGFGLRAVSALFRGSRKHWARAGPHRLPPRDRRAAPPDGRASNTACRARAAGFRDRLRPEGRRHDGRGLRHDRPRDAGPCLADLGRDGARLSGRRPGPAPCRTPDLRNRPPGRRRRRGSGAVVVFPGWACRGR